ncbi:MAG: GtrA family protein [Mesorhizobium sp.]
MLSLLATLLALAINAATGFKSLNAIGDNDSLLRLVEVRDLIAGQGWFDLYQYRMGPQGGLLMHWSRLVDAPIAAIVVAATALTGSVAAAETIARILWPASTFFLTVFFTVRAARHFGGDSAAFPALVASASALHFLGIYNPGALDHHNVQLMLTMASMAFLLAAPGYRPAAMLAGICAALTLAVGMETAPYVAVIGLYAAGLLAFDEGGGRIVARDYGLGFAGTSALVFAGTVAPSEWGVARCDAFSGVQVVLAILAGGGLAAIASAIFASRTRARRIAALLALGAIVAAALLAWFPECLAAPYAGLDPRLRSLWLDHVSEAQSVFELIRSRDLSVAARYATPAIALGLMAYRLIRGDWHRQDSLVATLLATAFVVSAWQVRGSTFSIALAIIPLADWIGKWRLRAEASPTPAVSLKTVLVWLVSLNPVWMGTAAAASMAIDSSVRATATTAGRKNCEQTVDFSALGLEPATAVLAPSNLGAPILALSGHRVMAGPYHRNIEGNLLTLDAFMGSAQEARAQIDRNHIGLIAFCRAGTETRILTEAAPNGFLAQLARGVVPSWLEPVARTSGKPLELYRVKLDGQ